MLPILYKHQQYIYSYETLGIKIKMWVYSLSSPTVDLGVPESIDFQPVLTFLSSLCLQQQKPQLLLLCLIKQSDTHETCLRAAVKVLVLV